MRYFFALLPIAVLLISGCISSAGSYGIVVESFDADFSSVVSEEPFKLMLKIRNNGEVEARDIKFGLFNTVGSDSKSQLDCENSCLSSYTLLPGDPESDASGETMSCIWNCRAPKDIPKNMVITYNPIVRISYVYGSSVARTVTFTSREELKRIKDSGQPMPSQLSSTVNSPVQLDLVFNGPVRYWEDQGKITFPLEIRINNVDSGVACYPDCKDKDNWNKVKLSLVQDVGVELKECDFDQEKGILLWETKSRTVRCEAEFTGIPTVFASGRIQKTLEVTADYEYFMESEASLSVTGTGKTSEPSGLLV